MTAFLIHPFAPWLIALVVSVTGLIFCRSSREHVGRRARIGLAVLGWPLLLLGLLMFFGAGTAAWRLAAARAAFPMPGKLIDVGGYRIHLACAGPTSARTVLWLSGGYSQGLWMANQHRALEDRNRSCLIDPAGTGWSDPGPFPRTMERIVDEVHRALVNGGERGPFVYAGHSWGGTIASNIAAKYPEDTAGLLLIDPSAPLWQVFYGSLGCPRSDASPLTLAGVLFGLGYIDALNPLRGASMEANRKALGPRIWDALVANELRPVARLSSRSGQDEPCRHAFSYVLAPDSLGDLPMVLILQQLSAADHLQWADPKLTPFERRNFVAFNDYAGRQTAALTRRSRIVHAPKGSGHFIAHTEAAFVQAQLDHFLAELASGTFTAQP